MKLLPMVSDEAACDCLIQSMDFHMSTGITGPVCVAFDMDDTVVYRNGTPRSCVVNTIKACQAHGVQVYIITARQHSVAHETSTHQELRDVGVSGTYTLHMRPGNVSDMDIPMWKYNVRCQLASATGAHMLFSVGDQWWDIVSCDRKIDDLNETTRPDIAYIVTDRSPSEPARAGLKLPEMI